MGYQSLGRDSNRGCNNPRHFPSLYEPEEPKENDIWFDLNYMILKYYDGANWLPIYGTGEKYILKTSDESLANTTTVQADNELFVSDLESNSIYKINLKMGAYGPTAADIKVNWELGGSAVGLTNRHCVGPASSSTNNLDTNAMVGIRGITAQNPYGLDTSIFSNIQEEFLIQTTGSTGSIQCKWAQVTSNATRITVTTDSYIVYKRIG